MLPASSLPQEEVELLSPQWWRMLPKVLWARLNVWAQTEGRYYLQSILVHMVLIIILGLIAGHLALVKPDKAPTFDTNLDANLATANMPIFKLGDTQLDPSVLDTEALTMFEPKPVGQLEQINDDSPVFQERGGGNKVDANANNLGGLGGFDFKALGDGSAVTGPGGVGLGQGTSKNPGIGGSGEGFGGRGAGVREAMVGAFGGTRQTERAVAAGLNWIARHQNADGSWSLDTYQKHCRDKSCTGEGSVHSTAAATALGLLPFLASAQTHESQGPYQKTIDKGLKWLINNQQADGNLAGGDNFILMYSHGLAAIAMCEAYGLTHDSRLGIAAQKSIDFIESAQDPDGGGWRYTPQQAGDTSVTGWQVMALKSAQMAGLKVNSETFTGAKKFLASVATESAGSQFSYLRGDQPSPTTTSVGLLCTQYMGAPRDDVVIVKGIEFLSKNLPEDEHRDVYYWYYASQVMHNAPGAAWDKWNRQMRRILVESQVRDGCATGSWDPLEPSTDAWGRLGGRLMQTSLSVLTLEIYYRYLPLYRLDPSAAAEKPQAAAQ